MTRGGGQYTHEISVPMTADMFAMVELLAKRGKTSKADVMREALRAHLDNQDDLIGSRSRYASRVAKQLDMLRAHVDRWCLLILATMLYEYQAGHGGRGMEFLTRLQNMSTDTEAAIKAVADKKAIPRRQ